MTLSAVMRNVRCNGFYLEGPMAELKTVSWETCVKHSTD